MRFLPDSLAGRTIALLFAGLVLTTAASLSIYMLDLFHGKGWDETFRNLQRIALIAAILDRVPAGSRPALLPALREPGLSIDWLNGGETPPPMRRDGMTRHLARDVRVLSGPRGPGRIDAGYLIPRREATGWLMPDPGPVQVWIGLSDASWLRVVVNTERLGGLWTLRVVLATSLLLAGILALGVWAGRRVTLPLARFAEAARRIGADVAAPPMPETGPSEIRAAAAAFNDMQGRIRRLLEDRALMLAALSHDLRTWLTRLRFRTEGIADPEQRRKAGADLDAMEAMLSTSLSFARDDAAAEPAALLDLSMLLQSLCDDLADAGRPVAYQGPAHVRYVGRPVSLRRAFANLLDNALAYGREASVTLVQQAESIAVTVADRGPGIPGELREQVFVPFFRMESSRSRETGGAGLGLTVARAIVRRHGGDITLDERPGGGLQVRVNLPVAAAQPG